MAKCACKKPNECEECPEWIFTFADLVMLMMGFFVILFVLKPSANPNPGVGPGQTNTPQWINVVGEIRDAFGYTPNPNSKDPVDQAMIQRRIQHSRSQGPSVGGMIHEPRPSPDGHDDQVTNIRIGKFATEGGKLCFAKGDATLPDQARKALNEVADAVKGHRNMILIKGHASLDDFPPDSDPSTYLDLSLRRAQAAADYLRSQGVDPSLLRVMGCSDFEPVVQHDYSPDAQMYNRRVEVEATATLVEEFQDPRTATTQPILDPTTQP